MNRASCAEDGEDEVMLSILPPELPQPASRVTFQRASKIVKQASLAFSSPRSNMRHMSLGSGKSVRAKSIQNAQIFKEASASFLAHISTLVQDRVYKSGDFIVEEGDNVNSMFIMVSGTAGLYSSHYADMCLDDASSLSVDEDTRSDATADVKDGRTRIDTLVSGSICGELAVLGMPEMQYASIVAETVCTVLELKQERLAFAMNIYPELKLQFSRFILDRLERTALLRTIQLPLFKSFDGKLLTLLGLDCKKRVYFKGDTILRDGRHADGTYIVNSGVVTLEKHASTIKTYTPGMHFCATAMLGVGKSNPGSWIAQQTCHVLVISFTNFKLAIEKYPCQQSCDELKQIELQEFEQLRETVQRITSRKIAKMRGKISRHLTVSLTHDVNDNERQMSDDDILVSIFQGWRKFIEERQKLRLQIKTRRQTNAEWIEWKRDALEKRRIKDSEQKLASAPACDSVIQPLLGREASSALSRSSSCRSTLSPSSRTSSPRNAFSPLSALSPRSQKETSPRCLRASRRRKSPGLTLPSLASYMTEQQPQSDHDGSDTSTLRLPRLKTEELSPTQTMYTLKSPRDLGTQIFWMGTVV